MSTISWTKVLCPVNFTAESQAALEVAADVAKRFHAPVTLLHVADEIDPATTGRMETLREQLVARGVEITTAVTGGHPETAIAHYADVHAFDLVVMGTHGWTGRAHELAGSVAESTVRSARCPVMVVHDRWQVRRVQAA